LLWQTKDAEIATLRKQIQFCTSNLEETKREHLVDKEKHHKQILELEDFLKQKEDQIHAQHAYLSSKSSQITELEAKLALEVHNPCV
jgi:predicted  nucleic acid-binding Zn-ribbon protein